MTIAAPAECWWEVSDGAPSGPEFDFAIASSRPGRRPYRIARGGASEAIVHHPRCESWINRGPGLCRHIREAIMRAEQPAADFLAQVHGFLSQPGWYQDAQAVSTLAAIKRAMDDAHQQIARNESATRTREELAGKTAADAIREFSGGAA
jgi:hypothetical protein